MARRVADGYLYIVDRSKGTILSASFNPCPRALLAGAAARGASGTGPSAS
jgi:shikimate kinase